MVEARRALCAGRTGCGKSTLVKERLIGPRTIVMDPKGDYREEPGFVRIETTPGWGRRFQNVLAKRWHGDFRIALITPAGGSPEDDLIGMCKRLFLIQAPFHDRIESRKVTLVCEEMAVSFPAGSLPQSFDPVRDMIRMGRDWGVDMVGVTQRPSEVNATFRGNVNESYIFALGLIDQPSREVVKRMLPRDAFALWEKMGDYEFVSIDDRGWKAERTAQPKGGGGRKSRPAS